MRKNPKSSIVAASLIVVGIGLATPAIAADDSAQTSPTRQAGEVTRSVWDGVKEAWSATKDTAKKAWHGTKETAREGWETSKETASGATKDFKEGWNEKK
jgi:hypothetical protein